MHFHYFWRQRQDTFIDNGRPSADTWLGAVLNAWNPQLVRSLAERQADDWFRHHPDGTISIYAPAVVKARREALVAGLPPPSEEDCSFSFNAPEFGYAAIWAAELGQQELLRGLLAHADAHMKPTWLDGGLYYPREDRSWDADGRMTYMDPLTGNALLGYARLNVPDGLRTLYERPWTAEHFELPALTDTSEAVDVLKAVASRSDKVLALTVRARRRAALETLSITHIPVQASWTLLVDGAVVARAGEGRVADGVGIRRGESGDLLVSMPLETGAVTDITLCWE